MELTFLNHCGLPPVVIQKHITIYILLHISIIFVNGSRRTMLRQALTHAITLTNTEYPSPPYHNPNSNQCNTLSQSFVAMQYTFLHSSQTFIIRGTCVLASKTADNRGTDNRGLTVLHKTWVY